MDKPPKFGARVYFYPDDGRIQVKQTVLRGQPPRHVIDEQKEKHVDWNNDTEIADAIRAAVLGKLTA